MEIEFGKKMRDIREANGWSLDEMAQKLGTTKQALSKYERGERTPKITVASKFADILHVPLEELVGLEEAVKEWKDPLTAEIMDNPDIRILLTGLSHMPPDQIKRAKDVMKAVFAEYANYFEEGNHDDT